MVRQNFALHKPKFRPTKSYTRQPWKLPRVLRSFSSSETDAKAKDRRQSQPSQASFAVCNPAPDEAKFGPQRRPSSQDKSMNAKLSSRLGPVVPVGCHALKHDPCHPGRAFCLSDELTGIPANRRKLIPTRASRVRHRCHGRHRAMQTLRTRGLNEVDQKLGRAGLRHDSARTTQVRRDVPPCPSSKRLRTAIRCLMRSAV